MISVAFSLATVATVGFFARWLFASATAGLLAAFFYAVFPGSVYYGRTFMPDAAMVFLLTAALYASARYLTDDERLSPGRVASATLLLALAYLAKPVAVVAVVPLACVLWERARRGASGAAGCGRRRTRSTADRPLRSTTGASHRTPNGTGRAE